jgi:hypothetical protein
MPAVQINKLSDVGHRFLSALAGLTSLREIKLEGIHADGIGSDGGPKLVAALTGLHLLASIDIANIHDFGPTGGTAALAAAAASGCWPHLASIALDGIGALQVADCADLARAIAVLRLPFERLSICRSDFPDEACTALFRGLLITTNSTITSTNTSTTIVSWLGLCHLKYLRICAPGRVGSAGAAALASAIAAGCLPHLETLDFSCNWRMGDDAASSGAIALGAAFGSGKLPHLTVLNLRHIYLRDAGCVAVMEGLSSGTPLLAELDLGSNKIGSVGLKSMSACLRGLPHLESISLYNNLFTDSDFSDFADTLAAITLADGRPQLKTILLDYNRQLTDASVFRLAALIGSHGLPQLRRLDLSSNVFGDAALVAMAAAVRRSVPHLRKLHLRASTKWGTTNVHKEGAVAMARAVPYLYDRLDMEALPGSPTGSVLDWQPPSLDIDSNYSPMHDSDAGGPGSGSLGVNGILRSLAMVQRAPDWQAALANLLDSMMAWDHADNSARVPSSVQVRSRLDDEEEWAVWSTQVATILPASHIMMPSFKLSSSAQRLRYACVAAWLDEQPWFRRSLVVTFYAHRRGWRY